MTGHAKKILELYERTTYERLISTTQPATAATWQKGLFWRSDSVDVLEPFQHDLRLVSRQDKHGVPGDL